METAQPTKDPSLFLCEISGHIASWLSTKEDRSVRAIEYYSGVNRNYITRLLNKEIAEAKLDVRKVHKILQVIVGDQNAANILLSNEITKADFIEYVGLPEKMIPLVKMGNELEFLVRNREMGLVLILAANNCGTTTEQIKSVCGDNGLIALNQLIERGYIQIKNQKISLADAYSDGTLSFQRDTYKFLLPLWTSFYQSDRAGKEWNYIAGVTEGINRNFQKRLQSKMDEFRSWITAELAKNENLGEIPIFVSMTMDSFTGIQSEGVLQ